MRSRFTVKSGRALPSSWRRTLRRAGPIPKCDGGVLGGARLTGAPRRRHLGRRPTSRGSRGPLMPPPVPHPDEPHAATGEPSLERVMGPGLLLLFIVGDILGTGIYALTGQVAKQVGGVVWLPFLVAFVVALITALSYLELVTKYPKAAGAALYTPKAFSIHFVTFIVAFAVMCSGITSATTASRAFAANLSNAFGFQLAGGIGIPLVAVVFMTAVAAINFR